MSPALIVGPLLRYVSEREATIWVETDAPCEVSVSAGELVGLARTFCVEGHHYAILAIEGLEPGTDTRYTVSIDEQHVWPAADDPRPPCSIRTFSRKGRTRLSFGSCRVSLPHEEPYTLPKDEDERGRGADALYRLAMRMQGSDRNCWPQMMILLGDQVYADEVSPGTLEFIRSRRDPDKPPGEQVADFEEYTRLYWDSWKDPEFRWLASTVSMAMIFDDHDIHDDWNSSATWLEEMRAKDWWHDRIVGGLVSYWVYQHLGNLSPAELAADELLAEVRRSDDAGALLRDFAERADRDPSTMRWSFSRDIGGSRLVTMDSRAARELNPDDRKMLDDDEWQWVVEGCEGDFDHLLLATSIPILMSPGMHHLESWNEAVSGGAWGRLGAKLGERMRQAVDLEHWGAFRTSFDRVAELLREVGAGERGSAPASIVALSGDVHHAFLAEVAFRRGSGVGSAVYQAVCSPVRNPLSGQERMVLRIAASKPAEALTRLLARAAGVADPEIRWRIDQNLTFDNQIATLDLEGPRAHLWIEKAGPWEEGLEASLDRRLA